MRDKLTAAYPALKELEPQVLDSNTLAFRESEIILATIETLKTKEIVSYPMHDAVICKASEAGQVAEKLQQEFERNCGIRPALTIQTLSEEKEILGCYTPR